MTDLRQAAQQALEALEELDGLDTETECVTIDVGDVMDALRTALEQQAEPVQEPFDDLATELFVVAQISPADDGFSDTIDRIESWLQKHFSTQPQRKPLTVKEINALPEANGYWPIGMNDRILRLIRAAEAAHGIKEGA